MTEPAPRDLAAEVRTPVQQRIDKYSHRYALERSGSRDEFEALASIVFAIRDRVEEVAESALERPAADPVCATCGHPQSSHNPTCHSFIYAGHGPSACPCFEFVAPAPAAGADPVCATCGGTGDTYAGYEDQFRECDQCDGSGVPAPPADGTPASAATVVDVEAIMRAVETYGESVCSCPGCREQSAAILAHIRALLTGAEGDR